MLTPPWWCHRVHFRSLIALPLCFKGGVGFLQWHTACSGAVWIHTVLLLWKLLCQWREFWDKKSELNDKVVRKQVENRCTILTMHKIHHPLLYSYTLSKQHVAVTTVSFFSCLDIFNSFRVTSSNAHIACAVTPLTFKPRRRQTYCCVTFNFLSSNYDLASPLISAILSFSLKVLLGF